MAIKSGWGFESKHGFTGSAGKTMVNGYARGGKVSGVPKFAEGGMVKTSAVKTGYQQSEGAGKKGPDLNVKFAGNHLAYKKGGMVEKDCDGGMVGKARGGVMKRAAGGMTRPMGMPKAPVVGMKRMRHPPMMAGAGAGPKPMMPAAPGMPAMGSAPMGVPGKPGSAPRLMNKGGKTGMSKSSKFCGGDD